MIADVALDIIITAVVALATILVVLFFLVSTIEHVLTPLHFFEGAVKVASAFVDERQEAIWGLLNKGRELLRHGDAEGAEIQFNAALILEPNIAKKLTKEYRDMLWSELFAKGAITETWQIRKKLQDEWPGA